MDKCNANVSKLKKYKTNVTKAAFLELVFAGHKFHTILPVYRPHSLSARPLASIFQRLGLVDEEARRSLTLALQFATPGSTKMMRK